MNLRALLAEPAAEHRVASELFVRGLAIVYAIAFASLAVQIDGLAGPDGILPFGRALSRALASYGYSAVWQIPTLFWFGSSDWTLLGASLAGVVVALLLCVGIGHRRLLLSALYVLYLSLYQAGQIFTSFQWDYLLLECGFLAIFLVGTPTRVVVWLYHWLLFRLRFESGWFKLASGDPAWRDFSALDYYFETQPLPHTGSWYAHQLPHGLLHSGVGFTYFTELIVPFLIFLPRPFRIFAAAVTIVAQLLIIATSNHNFINLLTILLCLFVLDDRIVARYVPAKFVARIDSRATARAVPPILVGLVGALIVTTSVATFLVTQMRRPLPETVYSIAGLAPEFGIGSVFHLFPTMQTERQELQIEGSDDGIVWQVYEFRYKPGPLDVRPAFVMPHQPRLDWMMWFVPPQSSRTDYWFGPFLQALHENRPAVTGLLARNPFEGRAPPQRLRVRVYRYRFTTPAERALTGNWWNAQLLGEYPDVPPRQP